MSDTHPFKVGQRVSWKSRLAEGRSYTGTIVAVEDGIPHGRNFVVRPDMRNLAWTDFMSAEELTEVGLPPAAAAAAAWWVGFYRGAGGPAEAADRLERVLGDALAREMAQGYDRFLIETKAGHPSFLLATALGEADIEATDWLPAWATCRIDTVGAHARRYPGAPMTLLEGLVSAESSHETVTPTP